MSLYSKKKQYIVSTIKEKIHSSISVIFIDFNRAKSNDLDELRKICRESKVFLKVVRNTLIRQAIKNWVLADHKKILIGSTLLAFSEEDPGIAVRLLKKFIVKNAGLKIKAAFFDGQVLWGKEVDHLSSLPTKQQSVLRMIWTIRYACLGKFLCTMAAVIKCKDDSSNKRI